MKRTFLVFLMTWLVHLLSAQTNAPIQLEFSCTQYSTELQCVPCQSRGVCVLYPTISANDTTFLNVNHYDVNLQLVKHCQTTVDPTLSYAASVFNDNSLYILYQNRNKRKRECEGTLFCYRCDTHELEIRNIEDLPIDNISSFSVMDGNIFFVASTGKDNSNVFYLPEGMQKCRSLYLDNAPDYTIDGMLTDTINRRILACVNTSSGTKNNVIWLVETTLDGHPLRIIDLPDTGEVRFQNARIAQIDSARFMLTGTFQHRKSIGNTAGGTYTTLYEGGRFSEPQLIPFNNNRSNSSRSGNDVLYLMSRIYHDSLRYVTMAESFYPEYRYSTTYSYGIPSTEPIFVGYRFLNAEIRIFNDRDSLLWTYSFPFDNLLVSNLTTHLRADFIGSNTLLYFIQNQSMTTMLLDENMEILDPIRTVEVLPVSRQASTNLYTTGITRWYNNYFLLIGYKFPKNGNNKTKKTAYFINKLLYQ